MKNILKKLNWQTIEQSLTDVTKRFPVSVVSLVVMAGLLTVALSDGSLLDEDSVAKGVLALLFAALMSLSFSLLSESFGWRKQKKQAAMGAAIILSAVYWLILPRDFSTVYGEFYITQIIIQASLVLSVVFAMGAGPWLRKQYLDTPFYNLVITEGMYLAQSAIVALVTFLAGASVLGTVHVLFDPAWIQEEMYIQWLVIAAVLVGPLFFLVRFPRSMPVNLEVAERFLHFMVRYIALPFICVYFVILYAYTVKVLINFGDWPQGIVSWLVIWFSTFGYITYILSYHLRVEAWVQRIRYWTPILLLPQLGMLFYAIGLRINQHSWTVNRYLVVAFGVWLLVLSLYFIVRQQQSKLIVIPASLFVAMVWVAVGPWNMFAVSQQAQVNRLEAIVAQMNVVDTTISNEESSSGASIVRYLCEYHGCEQVLLVPGVQEIIQDQDSDNAWQINQALGLVERWPDRDNWDYNYYYYEHPTYNISSFEILEVLKDYPGESEWYIDVDIMELVSPTERISLSEELTLLAETVQRDTDLIEAVYDVVGTADTYRIFVESITIENGVVTEIAGKIAY